MTISIGSSVEGNHQDGNDEQSVRHMLCVMYKLDRCFMFD